MLDCFSVGIKARILVNRLSCRQKTLGPTRMFRKTVLIGSSRPLNFQAN